MALILLPIIGIGGFAWYQRRAEQVKPAPKPPLGSVESCGMSIKPATKQLQATGVSSEIQVMIKYSGKRPLWWGAWTKVANVDPLLNVSQQKLPSAFKSKENLAYGAVLTTTSKQKGKPIIKTQWRDKGVGLAGVDMVNNQLVLSHEVAMDKIPFSAGEVTFRGLYLVPGGAPIRVNCVVRPAFKIIGVVKRKLTRPSSRKSKRGSKPTSKAPTWPVGQLG